jgi:N,N'-diacetyllegionaminate synthase
MKKIRIGNKRIGQGEPCFIVAEAGVNHNGDINLAKKLVAAAKDAGADAVKFQTFSTESIITRHAPKAAYQRQTTPEKETQMEMIKKLELGYQDFKSIKKLADELDIIFLSTPTAPEDIDFLVKSGVPALKVASMDIVNYPLLGYFGAQGIPVILSTGMSTMGEIEKGLAVLRRSGARDLILLQCVTNYPIKDNEANLLVMDTLRKAFQIPVGFSDHTAGITVPIAAAARGACLIEKHFTLDRKLPGPDHASSLDPDTFKAMVQAIRTVESALGSPVKKPLPVEKENRKIMRRSIVAAEDIPANTVLQPHHFALKRPGTGLGAEQIELLVGLKTMKAISKDEMITFKVLPPPHRK